MINEGCIVVGVSASAEDHQLRRSYSDHDLSRLGPRLQEEEELGAEFYTAVGPDGKEIILRKYLEDQAETQDQLRIGFVSQALGHLQQELGAIKTDPGLVDPVLYYQHQRDLLLARESDQDNTYHQRDQVAVDRQQDINHHQREQETDYHQRFHRLSGYPGYEQGYDSEEDYRHKHYGGVVTGYADQKYSNTSHVSLNSLASRSPKHNIRSPIIEETESTVERELISRDQSRRLGPLGSTENLNLSLSEGRYEGQETGPQYAETKSSILRRRNSKAKLSQKKSGNERGGRRRRRVNSLSDLSSSRAINSNLKRRNSISYDDIQRYDRLRQYDDLSQSRSTTLSKKFSVYTGLSPKEKIEYDNYTDIR